MKEHVIASEPGRNSELINSRHHVFVAILLHRGDVDSYKLETDQLPSPVQYGSEENLCWDDFNPFRPYLSVHND